MRLDIYHNIRWSKYKARVFSRLHAQAVRCGHEARFYQIADTEGRRAALTGVDLSVHQYPHTLLFKGSYDDISSGVLCRTLFLVVARSKAELVLIPGYERIEFWCMLLAAILTGKRRAVFSDSTLLDKPQSRFKGWLKRAFFRLCDGYFSYGTRGQQLLEHYGAKPDRIYRRVQAASLLDSYSAVAARELRLARAPKCDAPRFLYVGRFSEEKGLDDLIEAFAVVCASLPRARLVLVGAGPLEQTLQRQCQQLGIVNQVNFAGGMEAGELAVEYASATCLVLPSRSEPWGLVVNEALHYGCPVVVSDRCGCVPELVPGGLSGSTFVTGDIPALVAELSRRIEESVDRAAVADSCLALIADYTPERSAAQILNGCEAILAVRRHRI